MLLKSRKGPTDYSVTSSEGSMGLQSNKPVNADYFAEPQSAELVGLVLGYYLTS